MGTEIELKLAGSQSAMRKAMALPWLTKIASNKAEKQRLISVYFDTRNLTLQNCGVSLRVRKVGERRLQTIKATNGALVERNEWEHPINQDWPQLNVSKENPVRSVLKGDIKRQLQPVFETDVERIVMPVRVAKSDIELAFDTGRISTGEGQAEIAEIEIELKQGNRHDAVSLAKRLARVVPVTFGVRTKADRGYALLKGNLEEPVFAAPISIPPSSTAEEAFVIIGFECLRHFASNELAVRHRDGEGIHQMRVGLRRLRAAMSLFKRVLQGPGLRRVKSELKWLTEQLGPARDYDVFASETIEPFRSCGHCREEFEALEADVSSQCQTGFNQAKAAVESERFKRILLDTALWLFDGDWRHNPDLLDASARRQPAGAFAQQELDRRTRKIVKRVRKLKGLEARRRHKLRIAVKKVRYTGDFFESLDADHRGKRKRRTFNRSLKKLQNALGDLNDMHLHGVWAEDVARATSATRKAFAMGYLSCREEAQSAKMVADAMKAGKQLRSVLR